MSIIPLSGNNKTISCMEGNMQYDTITLKLQMRLNKRMYETGGISHNMYAKANEALLARLTDSHGTSYNDTNPSGTVRR